MMRRTPVMDGFARRRSSSRSVSIGEGQTLSGRRSSGAESKSVSLRGKKGGNSGRGATTSISTINLRRRFTECSAEFAISDDLGGPILEGANDAEKWDRLILLRWDYSPPTIHREIDLRLVLRVSHFIPLYTYSHLPLAFYHFFKLYFLLILSGLRTTGFVRWNRFELHEGITFASRSCFSICGFVLRRGLARRGDNACDPGLTRRRSSQAIRSGEPTSNLLYLPKAE
jgi:hypothetical protein